MPKPSRWTAEKRFEIVQEVLRQKERVTQIARRHGVSDALLHRWRERFFEGGKAALAFESGGATRGERAALGGQIEELQKVIGEQAVELRFLKKLSQG